MRSNEERIAEIYRRSEAIIRQRKKRRKQVLLACVPLVLCMTLFAAFVLPAMMPASMKDAAAPENMLADASGGRGLYAAKVKVTGPNLVLLHTLQQEVLRISDYINNCTLEPPASPETPENNGVPGKEAADTHYGDITDTADTGYTITLFLEDGSKTQYRLEDGLLRNLETNKAYPLSPTQVSELKALLGIPS